MNLLFAEEMSFDEISKAYKKSYDFETIAKYDKAVAALKEVYQIYPETYTVNLRLGWLYYMNGNFANALQHLNTALEISPFSVEILNTILLVRVAQLDWNVVEQQAIKVVSIDSYNITANYWYCYALRMKQKYTDSMTNANKMLTVFPTSTSFLLELGENYYALGNMEQSKSLFESVVILDPTNETAAAYLKTMK
jgi:tetratricopeptide (TPR) repeat protein